MTANGGVMKIRHLLIVVMAGAAALTGCGSGDGGGSATQSLADVQARLASGGVSCDGTPGPYQRHEGEMTLGVDDPVEALECTTENGVEVQLSRWETSKQAKEAFGVVMGMVCSFNGSSLTIQTSTIMVNVGDSNELSKDEYDVLAKIAKALNAEVLDPCGDGEVDRDSLADTTGQIGAPVSLGDGTTMTLTNPRLGGDETGPWIEVDVAYENSSSTSARPPMVEVACDGSDSGDGFQIGSTFDPNAEVKPGTTGEGTLNLLPTANSRTGEGSEQCAAPARFIIGSDGPTVPLPDDVLDSYNEAATEAPG